MKRGIIFLILAVLALAIVLSGCKEQAGQAFKPIGVQQISPVVKSPCPSSFKCIDKNTLGKYDCKGRRLSTSDCEFGCDSMRRACNACAEEVLYRCDEPSQMIQKVVKSPTTNCKESISNYKDCAPDGCTDGSPECNAPKLACEPQNYSRCVDNNATNFTIAPPPCVETQTYSVNCPYGCDDSAGYAVCMEAPDPGCCVGTVGCSRAFYASECSGLTTFESRACEEIDSCDLVACCHDIPGIPHATYQITCSGITPTPGIYVMRDYVNEPSIHEENATRICDTMFS